MRLFGGKPIVIKYNVAIFGDESIHHYRHQFMKYIIMLSVYRACAIPVPFT